MAGRAPPRFVPTLTEVVPTPASAAPAPAPAPVPTAAPAARVTTAISQEQLAQRVLQRIDLALDRRVREAIATVVLEQTSTLAPLLRERLETVVRQLVAEAVAEERQARQRGPGAGGG